jgi:hypothetical protein
MAIDAEGGGADDGGAADGDVRVGQKRSRGKRSGKQKKLNHDPRDAARRLAEAE